MTNDTTTFVEPSIVQGDTPASFHRLSTPDIEGAFQRRTISRTGLPFGFVVHRRTRHPLQLADRSELTITGQLDRRAAA